MTWSKIAFGAARCIKGVAEHELSLMRALQGGITVVDTSANYTGGSSEKMVGEVVDRWCDSQGVHNATRPKVVSKFGYTSAESKLPGVIMAAPGLGHSLHPDFYRSQLASSRERLGNTPVDVYLVEHPDHHLALKLGLIGERGSSGVDMDTNTGAIARDLRLEEARRSFYEDMTVLFEAMEQNVKADGSGAYGVSSVGLSLPDWDPMHISWEKLMSCAEEAALRAGRKSNSFNVVQVPANLLETTVLVAAPAMQKSGLMVMACDPLRAATPEGRFHLVDDALRGGLPTDYMDVCREVLEHFNLEIPEGREPTEEEEEIRQGCQFLQQLVQDMNSQLTSFTSFENYEDELGGSITPIIADKFEALDEVSADLLQKFFDRYGRMVRYSCAQRVRDMVTTGEGCASGAHQLSETESLKRYAIRWLMDRPGLVCTVVEIEQPDHVDDALMAMRQGGPSITKRSI